MKAIFIVRPGKVEIREIPMPRPNHGEALLKICYGGICGSDLSAYSGTFAYFDYPRIPGHEFSAEIVDIEPNNLGLKAGTLVTANPYFNCGKCYSCQRGLVNACMDNQTMGCQRDGAFCEYIVMPVERLYHGRGLSPQILATIEPYCIGYHGVSVASVRPGENVLIVGGGTIGTMAAIAAKAAGANVYLCDLPEAKEKIRNSCRALDLNGIVLNEGSEAMAESVRKITGTTLQRGKVIGRGFDVCIEAVGHPQTFQTCIDCAAFGGRIVLIGVSKQKLDFNFNDIQKKELKIFGSRNAMKLDFLHAIDAAVSGQLPIDQVITNIYSFGDVARAFEEYKRERGKMIKVLLDFT